MWSRIFGLIVILAFSLFAGVLLAVAQEPGKVYRIGWLGNEWTSESQSPVKGFLEQMRALGWVEGQNFVMEYQTAPESQLRERAPALAAELVRRNVDVMVVLSTPGALAAKASATTIPIVMAGSSRPVMRGLIESLARPGGNVTGLTNSPGRGFATKRLGLLKEALPGISRVAVLLNPLTAGKTPRPDEHARVVKYWQTYAQRLGLTALVGYVGDATEYTDAFAMFTQENADAMFVGATSLNQGNVQRITDFALTHRLPIMTSSYETLNAGGLMFYNVDWVDLRRRSAFYVDKILRGARPSELPVERPDKFDFVINLKTAEALGITIPPTVLYQATRIIR